MGPNEENKEKEEDDDFISEDLHSKLLSMVNVEDNKKAKANKKTRILRIKNTNKKTKKNK